MKQWYVLYVFLYSYNKTRDLVHFYNAEYAAPDYPSVVLT